MNMGGRKKKKLHKASLYICISQKMKKISCNFLLLYYYQEVLIELKKIYIILFPIT